MTNGNVTALNNTTKNIRIMYLSQLTVNLRLAFTNKMRINMMSINCVKYQGPYLCSLLLGNILRNTQRT